MKLAGKTAIVTGSGRGIGRAIALKLAAEGARVVVNDLDPGPAKETEDLVEGLGARAVAVPGAASPRGASPTTWSLRQSTRFGGLDIVVNNAGYTWDSVIQKTTDEQWEAMLDIHLTAPFRLLRSAAPVMRGAAKRRPPRGGPSFARSSTSPLSPARVAMLVSPDTPRARQRVIGLTKTLAKEWGRSQITVNAVAFGLIKTRLTEAPAVGDATIRINDRDIKVGIGAELLEAMENGIPLGRAGTPEDAANAVYLFCIPESDYITGQVVVCGGGLVL